jgi:hypothetical protein
MSPNRPSSYRDVAQRIVANTTNLFATGLILMIGVVMGRQILSSWSANAHQTAAANPSPIVADPNGESNKDAWIQFGDSSAALRRIEITGTLSQATAELRLACRTAAESEVHHDRADAAMLEWLQRLGKDEPVERNAGKWLLYERKHPLPMVVVISDAEKSAVHAGKAVGTNPSVLSWGLVFPSNGESSAVNWTAFVFSPARPAVLAKQVEELVLPADCRRFMSIAGGGTSILGFVSQLEPEALATQWDSVQATRGRAIGDWQTIGSSWHRRYELPTGRMVDVQFAVVSPGEILGFCLSSVGK